MKLAVVVAVGDVEAISPHCCRARGCEFSLAKLVSRYSKMAKTRDVRKSTRIETDQMRIKRLITINYSAERLVTSASCLVGCSLLINAIATYRSDKVVLINSRNKEDFNETFSYVSSFGYRITLERMHGELLSPSHTRCGARTV